MAYGMVMAELFKQIASGNGAAVPDEQIKAIVAEVEKQPEQMLAAFNGRSPTSPRRSSRSSPDNLQSLQTQVGKTEASEQAANAKLNDLLLKSTERYPVTLNPRFGTFDPKSLAIDPGRR